MKKWSLAQQLINKFSQTIRLFTGACTGNANASLRVSYTGSVFRQPSRRTPGWRLLGRSSSQSYALASDCAGRGSFQKARNEIMLKNLIALAVIAIGSLGAYALMRLLQSLLFEVSANDVSTYALVAGALFLIALLACYLPARRATKVDPLVALRYE